MQVFIYKWLPIFFGCHCLSERSFHLYNKQFPLCARCTGELIGILIGSIFFVYWHPTLLIQCLLLVPLIIDGLLQLFTRYKSSNTKRLLTGLLFGYGLLSLFFTSVSYTYHAGQTMALGLS